MTSSTSTLAHLLPTWRSSYIPICEQLQQTSPHRSCENVCWTFFNLPLEGARTFDDVTSRCFEDFSPSRDKHRWNQVHISYHFLIFRHFRFGPEGRVTWYDAHEIKWRSCIIMSITEKIKFRSLTVDLILNKNDLIYISFKWRHLIPWWRHDDQTAKNLIYNWSYICVFIFNLIRYCMLTNGSGEKKGRIRTRRKKK